VANKVLISGGTGLIGSHLTEFLLDKGYDVRHLSRTRGSNERVQTFIWDVDKMEIEKEALLGLDFVIHLAGAGVADKSWSSKRKKEILESRTKSSKLLIDVIKGLEKKPEAFISSSGVGYYGSDTGEELISESHPAGDDFLAEVCRSWEYSVEPLVNQGVRLIKLRTGIVLSDKGGALPKLAQPIKLGVGAALGTGSQYMSWIHIHDMARMIVFCMENKNTEGVYNAVGPNPKTNKKLSEEIAEVYGKKLLPINVPSFALKIMLGELSQVVLGGNKVSNKKISGEGFNYLYEDSKVAVASFYSE
jgi:uncharacterized protein